MPEKRITKRVSGAAIAIALSTAGVTAIPEEVTHKNLPLTEEVRDELRTGGWNSETIPIEGTAVIRESWLLPNETVEVTPTKFESTFYEGWLNYLDENGDFQVIDTSFVSTNIGFTVKEAPFNVLLPPTAGKTAALINNNRWDNRTNEEITEQPYRMEITALGVVDVPGRIEVGDLLMPTGIRENVNYVVYDGAYPTGDLIYYVEHGTAPRLAKLVRLNSEPPSNVFEFEIDIEDSEFHRFVRGKKTRWTEQSALGVPKKSPVRIARPDSETRGIGFRKFQAWDHTTSATSSQLVSDVVDIQADISPMGDGSYRLSKILPSTFLANATYPVLTDTTTTVYPDADTETTSVDGQINEQNETTWNSAHDSSNGDSINDTSVTARIRARIEGDGEYTIIRNAYLFDTSSIPDSDTISSATMSLYGTSATNDDDDGDDFIAIVSSNPASDTALVTQDFDLIGDAIDDPTEMHDTGARIQIESISTSAYNDWALNSTGINNISKTGITKFGAREGHDILDNPVVMSNGQDNSIVVSTADETGTSQDPKLVVEHEAARRIIFIQ